MRLGIPFSSASRFSCVKVALSAPLCRFNAFGKLAWQNAKKRKAEIVELTAEMECCIPDPGKAQELEGAEIGRLLSGFLKGLSKESRLIFLRRYWYFDSVGEIARRLDCTESKVTASLHRSRNQLRRKSSRTELRTLEKKPGSDPREPSALH